MFAIKKIIQEKSNLDWQAFMQARSPQVREMFDDGSMNSWIEFAVETEVFEAAARLLYPEDKQALRRLGAEVAQRHFTGIYKIFLRIPSVGFVVKRASQIYKTLYDAGDAGVEDLKETSCILTATGLESLSHVQHEYICGFLTRVVELTGVKNVQVTHDASNPHVWRWMITWET